MSPRPILKHSATVPPNHHPSHHVVHFPPSPSLTCTFAVYSSSTYDRSPIVVSPNTCALPERGCPGRTYTLDDPASPPTPPVPQRGHPYGGRDLHPRALAFNSFRQKQSQIDEEADHLLTHPYPALPSLIPDLSSESEESDSFAGHLPEPASSSSHHIHGLAIPLSHHDKYTTIDMYGSATPSALSFLPYPPSSPPRSPHSREEDSQVQKTRRRRDRDRKHESSRDPDRIRAENSGDAKTDLIPPKSRCMSKVSGSYKALSLCSALSSFSIEDDGCLGGF
ncbi:hypothetical protein BD779DRAFT_1469984 [Infundibulicybe gibba]|nr:hypothetical protein BD779DRAFT_1469984 [Infundibulicybe gibba]